MDRKILKNEEKRQGLIDELYADKDLTLDQHTKLTMANISETKELLMADRKYDAKKRR